jgi:hypothetical protein
MMTLLSSLAHLKCTKRAADCITKSRDSGAKSRDGKQL